MSRCVKCGQKLSGEEPECPCCGMDLKGAQGSMLKDQSESAHSQSDFFKVPQEKPSSVRKINPAGLSIIFVIIAAAAYYFLRPGFEDFNNARSTAINYLKYIDTGDMQGVRELTCAEERHKLESFGPYEKEMLRLVREMQPPQPRIAEIQKEKAYLLVKLISDDETYSSAAGVMKLVKEYNGWKVAKLDWKLKLGNKAVYRAAKTIKFSSYLPAPPVKKIPEALYADADFLPLFGEVTYQVSAVQPELVKEFTEFEYPVFTFSPAGNYLLAAGYGNYIAKLFLMRDWNVISSHTMKNRPAAADYCGSSFVLSDVYGYITAVGQEWGWPFKQVASDAGTQAKIYGSTNRKYMVSITFNKQMSVYETEKFSKISDNTSFMPYLTCGAFWPCGPYFFAGTNSRRFIIWDLAAGKGRTYSVSKVTECMITSISFSPDGKYFITTHNDSSIVLFDTATQKEIKNFFVRDRGTMCSDFSPDGKYFATGHAGGWVYFWSMPDAKQVAAFKLHDDMVLNVKFIPGANQIATSGNDHKIRIWDLQ